MKKFWKMLLLLPLFPLFGLAAGSAGEEDPEDDPEDDDDEEDEEDDEPEEDPAKKKQGAAGKAKGGKGGQQGRVFTQAQVNAMMTEEKKQGRRAVLNALGVKSVEEAKRVLAAKGKPADDDEDDDEEDEPPAKKSKSTKSKASSKSKNNAVEDATARYGYLIACIKAGVSPDDADDVVDLVLKRMEDEEDFDEALKGFKKAKPAFFGTQVGGTGNALRGKQKGGKESDSLGARLGKQVPKGTAKNPYFDN